MAGDSSRTRPISAFTATSVRGGCSVGCQVRIVQGLLTGVTGKIFRITDNVWFWVAVDSWKTGAYVVVEANAVEPIQVGNLPPICR